MLFAIPVYQAKHKDGALVWTTLGLGKTNVRVEGRNDLKLQEQLVRELRKAIEAAGPGELERFQMRLGTKLERLRLELNLRGEQGKKRKETGLFPLVVEPRWAGRDRPFVIAYHPHRQDEWFPVQADLGIVEQANAYFSQAWAEIEDIPELTVQGKDTIRAIPFDADVKSILDELPDKKKGIWDDLKVDPVRGQAVKDKRGLQVLPGLGTNLSARAIDGSLAIGVPRSPFREQLQLLLCGDRKQSVLLVGPAGVGKTTIINHLVKDLLESDGWEAHRNLDRAHSVWQIAGKRLIAGMSYVGDWEQRCVDLLHDARKRRIVLFVDDLHAWGRLGRSRESERNFADFFRGPVSRGEVTIIAEVTPERLQRLEDDAPSFVSLFTRVMVGATSPSDTLRMMIGEARRLERRHRVQIAPHTYRAILELGAALYPNQAFPGKALDLLRHLMAREETPPPKDDPKKKRRADEFPVLKEIGPQNLVRLVSQRTGLSTNLLRGDTVLKDEGLRTYFEHMVLGQREALGAAVDLIMRIRTGLVDPRRPYGVYLFTGPTGTGKTELAKAISRYLYGEGRLVRFDMSELSSWDAPSRLIGDRWNPQGLLTQAVLEQPFCVVLLDEIEKAHPSVLNLLLQLFDDGRLTDAGGNTASFTQTVIIMTSNLGARQRSAIGFGESAQAVMADVAKAVKEFFPPELFNRIDRVVPFAPLDPKVARGIAQKELHRLLQRRGLVERNIFVSLADGLLDKVVTEAFDPKDGARGVKRYLEEKVASLFTEAISGEKPTALRCFTVETDAAGRFSLDAQPVREAELACANLPLEPLLALPTRKLREHIPSALDFLGQLEQGDALGQLGKEIREQLGRHRQGDADSAERLFQLDSMRERLRFFRERLNTLTAGPPLEESEEVEIERFGTMEVSTEDGSRSYRLFDRREFVPPTTRAPSREEILGILAEVQFLKRALKKVGDPNQHAVFVELVHPVSTGSYTLLESEVAALRAGRSVESVAVRWASGTLAEQQADSLDEGEFEYYRQLVIKIVGPCVLDQLQHEHGCHVWTSLSEDPELIRVRVVPAGPDETALQFAEKTDKASLRTLLPLVRTFRFDAAGNNASAPCEIEDFTLGFSETVRIRWLRQAVERLLLLRLGRAED